MEGISKLARRASEGFTVIECPALACASGWFFEAQTGVMRLIQDQWFEWAALRGGTIFSGGVVLGGGYLDRRDIERQGVP